MRDTGGAMRDAGCGMRDARCKAPEGRQITMRDVFLMLLLLFFASIGLAADKHDSCITCHTDTGTAEAEAFKHDVHFAKGLSCAACHGGDSTSDDMEVSMSPDKGFIGVPKAGDIPKVCGKCHANMRKDFDVSAHGNALKMNSKGPNCVSCHGIHNIANVKDKSSPVFPTNVTKTCAKCHGDAEYMKQFNPGLPVDQYDKYLTSIHGKRNSSGDAKAATCVSCHSNHLIYQVKDPRSPVYPMNIPKTCSTCHSDAKYMAEYHIPTNQYEGYVSSVHGLALMKNSDLSAPACNSCHGNHGAAPPGVNNVAAVCGQCHQANAELYDKSVHHAVFEQQSLPGCVVCHGNHEVKPPQDNLIGFDEHSTCGNCHADVKGDKAAPVIRSMQATLKGLTGGQVEATNVLANAEQLGMDVAEAKYSLKDVNQSLIETRVKIHSFESKQVSESAQPGLKVIAQAKETGLEAIKEYYFRRKGLGVSTLLLTFLAVLLYMKIRQIERRH